MYTTMKVSHYLQHILDCAEKMREQSGSKILTANHLLAAVLSDMENGFKDFSGSASENDSDEIGKITTLISQFLNDDKMSDKIKLLTTEPSTFLEELQFGSNISKAEKICKSREKGVISADILLECVLSEPTRKIEIMLRKTQPEAGAVSDDDSKKMSIDEIVKRVAAATAAPTKKAESDEQGSVEQSEKKEPEAAEPYTSMEKIATLTQKVKAMQKKLSSVVFGQNNAINILTSGYFQSELLSITDSDRSKPKATFLFAGPPGVGKTFLAEQIAELLDIPFMRFDMSEYAERDSTMDLCGTNPSFKNAKEGLLTGFVKRNPECVLLFDEIEKAHINAIHLFLQILDAGRLSDTNTGKPVSFKQAVIIFTTNAGRKVYEDAPTPNLSQISRKTILKALEKDIDPITELASFPAAICSRFATGNVVMFNHMEAHTLRAIAEKEVNRNARAFEEKTGTKCNISDDVYSCILLAEGGHADARTVTSRASSFFSTELYELFRLVSAENNGYEIENIEEINIDLDLSSAGETVERLFRGDDKACIMVYVSESIRDELSMALEGYEVIAATSYDEAVNIVKTRDVDLILCDLYVGRELAGDRLNIEDVDSAGRNFFRYACEKADAPTYVVFDKEHIYTDEEVFSLLKEGARGAVSAAKDADLRGHLQTILMQICHQASMINLAKSNKVVTYQTAQTISSDGKSAEIKLYDIALDVAVDADDTNSILSGASRPTVRFDDIIGADDAKEELKYFVKYLTDPKAFAKRGMGVPKGVLFYGPPGTGKTMLAKAVAGEANVTFMYAEGNHFLKKYVGEGEEAVHKLFATARKYAPAIIFIDEIDAIAKSRTGGEHSTDSILTAFLGEMDGFKTDVKKPVFVLAATNFEIEQGTEKSIDAALLRRFDRHIYIDLPDKNARIKFIKMKVDNSDLFDLSETEVENVAVRSTGMSLAQIGLVFEYSKRLAIKQEAERISDSIFEEAFESYNYGEEKMWDIAQLKKTAYHEAGHAFLCWHSGETPSYLTIVARGNHGGYMQHGDNEKTGSYSKKMLLSRIRTALGGRAAELVFYGDEDGLTTGAAGDLRTATAIAKSIVCDYGMDESVGLAVIHGNEETSEYLSKQVREAITTILEREMENAKRILSENRHAVDGLVNILLQKNHLSGKELEDIFRSFALTK